MKKKTHGHRCDVNGWSKKGRLISNKRKLEKTISNLDKGESEMLLKNYQNESTCVEQTRSSSYLITSMRLIDSLM